jgi:ataxia telangiectasia mutated family protein
MVTLGFERPEKGKTVVDCPKTVAAVEDLNHLAVPILPVDVQPSARYPVDRLETISRLKPFYELVGGINSPKRLLCTTSKGREVKILLKGRDDLRQDAILEQVFSVFNTLFKAFPATQRRGLNVPCYNVVPLAPTTGLIQWVDETITLTDYLVAKGRGSHERYYPSEYTHEKCRELMSQQDDQNKMRAFRKVLANFTPTLHCFFYEEYPNPAVWYEKRNAYAKSAATGSIVGYLVGLGDRHATNILLKKDTAELLHIDLGFAFEQGRLLKVPETIPFRLTREIVDGLGIHGVEGNYRSCCEATLSLAKENKELLQTVLETMIYDPLARWAVQLQPQPGPTSDGIEGNAASKTRSHVKSADADRAAARVRDKLQGYVDSEQLGVSSQVQKLFQMAMDEERLAFLFHGWSAWL